MVVNLDEAEATLLMQMLNQQIVQRQRVNLETPLALEIHLLQKLADAREADIASSR